MGEEDVEVHLKVKLIAVMRVMVRERNGMMVNVTIQMERAGENESQYRRKCTCKKVVIRFFNIC